LTLRGFADAPAPRPVDWSGLVAAPMNAPRRPMEDAFGGGDGGGLEHKPELVEQPVPRGGIGFDHDDLALLDDDAALAPAPRMQRRLPRDLRAAALGIDDGLMP
jgi:type IV secretion system protein VirD4